MSEIESEDTDYIMMADESGQEIPFAILSLVDLDDRRYAVLGPVAQLESESPDLDLYAFEVIEDGEDVDLNEVEDEELFNRIMDEAEKQWLEDEESDDAQFEE